MHLIIFILDLYIAAHAAWWLLRETNRTRNNALTHLLSRICNPFCRQFRKVELHICGNDASIALPVLTLAMIRIFLSPHF